LKFRNVDFCEVRKGKKTGEHGEEPSKKRQDPVTPHVASISGS